MSAGDAGRNSDSARPAISETVSTRPFPKTHVNYWKGRLEHRTYTHNGKTFEVPEWSVRIHFKGVRKGFDLDTANKEEAATKARDLYLSILAKGWSTTKTESHPHEFRPVTTDGDTATIGEFLAEVERTASLKPRTFRIYAQSLRQFAAYTRGVKSDASRYDYRNGGLAAWRQQVDAIPLLAISPAAVADWKVAFLKRAGTDPRRKLEVNRSFNSWLRNTKSLFSPQIINKPNFRIRIPKFVIPDSQRGEREAYWFETVDFERPGSMKFQAPAGITYEKLVASARNELRPQFGEAYKLFLLCLCSGLRRAEADVCLWEQLNPDDNSIRIEPNQYIEPKHGSGGTVYVDPAVMKELLSFKETNSGDFVVGSELEWKPTSYGRYRCEPHWRKLLGWLEEKGIRARKKVHELRKLFGDAIVKQNGIFAGSAQLRHATIQMTASHYTDPRQRAVLPVGSLFTEEPLNQAANEPAEQSASMDTVLRKRRGARVSNTP